MVQITSGFVRRLEVIIASIISFNLFLIVASFGFGMGNDSWASSSVLLLPQVLANLFALFYSYFKFIFLYRWIIQLLLSLVLAGVYIFFTVRVLPIAIRDSGQFLIKVVEVANVIIAVMLIIEAALATLVVTREKIDRPLEVSPRNDATATTTVVQEPPPVHIYQPRLDFSSSEQQQQQHHVRRVSALSGTSEGQEGQGAMQLSADQSYRIDILEGTAGTSENDEELEMEELPKYQRRRPTGSATIIDLANIQAVDPAVLTSVLGESALEIQNQIQLQQQQQQHAQGQDQLVVEALDVNEAPAYSPPLASSENTQITIDDDAAVGAAEESALASTLSPSNVSIEAGEATSSVLHPSIVIPFEPPVYMP
ncbi:hypothetical protein BGZ49_000862 [Haplosporangium sp. Z 27]|nr:hypothetical protein BGZ49_000862 [Haplosporangium sp. Z 27]